MQRPIDELAVKLLGKKARRFHAAADRASVAGRANLARVYRNHAIWLLAERDIAMKYPEYYRYGCFLIAIPLEKSDG